MAVQRFLFSDGGFTPGVGGAFGVQVVAYVEDECTYKRELVGYTYAFVETAKSAFDMEMHGLRAATVMMLRACANTS